MNKIFKLSAIAAALAMTGTAYADPAETKGGIKIKTEDGRFEANVNGRIQFDGYVFGDLEVDGNKTSNATSGTEFRRARITLSGKAYGWEYKFEEDFAGSGAGRNFCTGVSIAADGSDSNSEPDVSCATSSGTTSTVSHRDMFIATSLAGGKLTIGQFKPYRSMEELTSSNEITMMERPFTSASGIFGGRQFQQGVGYLTSGDNYTFGAAGFSVRDDAQARNEGLGYAVRGTYAPVNSEGSVVHLGLSYSSENRNKDTGNIAAGAALAGRRSPSTSLGSVAAKESADTIGLELATVQGPFYVQAEYMQMSLGQAAGAEDQDVTAGYVMASFHLTGESKGYKKGTGVFGSAKPASEGGAYEMALRYDFAENSDIAAEPEVNTVTVGLNYYVNPNVRFMLNYAMGESEVISSGNTVKTELDQLSLRAQFGF